MIARARGFTLVEIIIVIGVIGLLLGVGIPNLQKIKSRSVDEDRVADMGILIQGLEKYKQACRTYPFTLEADQNNGVPGVNSGECPDGRTLGEFLPPAFLDSGILDYIMYTPVRKSSQQVGRCRSYLLTVEVSSATSHVFGRLPAGFTTSNDVWFASQSENAWFTCEPLPATGSPALATIGTTYFIAPIPVPY